MLNLHKQEDGLKILSRIKVGTTELVENEESDFAALKEIVRALREEK
jgi:hypothetical protein